MGQIETDGIVVGRYSTIVETNIVKGLLESNGIEAFIRNAAMSNIFPNIPLTAAEIELIVREKDFKRAQAILDAKFAEDEL